MQARSALFDVYGDHLRARDDGWRGQAPVAALVRLLAPLGIAGPAVRTAVSRLVRQGWLVPVRLPAGAGYALTARGQRRLDEAAERIYRSGPPAWDRHWHLVVVGAGPPSRAGRERLTAQLRFLGYGPLGSGTWVSPHPAPELAAALAEAGAVAECFRAAHEGDARELVARAWDLPALARSYEDFLAHAAALVGGAGPGGDEAAFAARTQLVHAWRKFLFVDPGLPGELLAEGWPGGRAAAWFDQEAARLLPAARRYVDRCLTGA